jgi:hypothetical protein
MKRVISLENIGDHLAHAGVRGNRAWVAEITGIDGYDRPIRRFLRGQRDYSNANRIGSRGVMLHFIVEEGSIYEVNAPYNWSKDRRYFTTHDGSGWIELSREEAVRCLISRSIATRAS